MPVTAPSTTCFTRPVAFSNTSRSFGPKNAMLVGPVSPWTAGRTSRRASVIVGGVWACAALTGSASAASATPSTTAHRFTRTSPVAPALLTGGTGRRYAGIAARVRVSSRSVDSELELRLNRNRRSDRAAMLKRFGQPFLDEVSRLLLHLQSRPSKPPSEDPRFLTTPDRRRPEPLLAGPLLRWCCYSSVSRRPEAPSSALSVAPSRVRDGAPATGTVTLAWADGLPTTLLLFSSDPATATVLAPGRAASVKLRDKDQRRGAGHDRADHRGGGQHPAHDQPVGRRRDARRRAAVDGQA